MSGVMKDFMVPTLAMVQDLAFVEEASGTVEMLRLLDKVLRYDVDTHERVTLKKEVDVLTAIMALYRYRFGSFNYTLIIDEHLLGEEIEKYKLIVKARTYTELMLSEQNNYSDLAIRIYKDTETVWQIDLEQPK